MSKKKRSRTKKSDEETDLYSDGTFSFIVGYTSWGFPYGVTWEQALEDGFMDEGDGLRRMEMQEEFNDDDEIPF